MRVVAGGRRRIWVVAGTLVAGAVLLGVSLRVAPGDPRFTALTLILAGVWAAGARLSGPVPLGPVTLAGVARPVLYGLGLGAVFVLGALVVPAGLREDVRGVLAHADGGALAPAVLVAVVNAVAEELFFRGALFAAVVPPVLVTSVVYGLATVATGNPMLVLAAALLGPVWAVQRRSTGGVLAPMITHTTWSLLMLFVLPVVLGS